MHTCVLISSRHLCDNVGDFDDFDGNDFDDFDDRGGCRPRVEIIIGRAGGEQEEREREQESASSSPSFPQTPILQMTKEKGRILPNKLKFFCTHNEIEMIRPIQIDVQICW